MRSAAQQTLEPRASRDNEAGSGSDNRIFFGAFLELLLIIANIGTAVLLFRIVKRQNETLALGYVTARIVECAFIAVGILAVLTVVTLGQERSGAQAGDIAYALAALRDWTFILGPGFVVGVGNGLILGYLMYRSGLVPRPLATFGLIGGPLNCIAGNGSDCGWPQPRGLPQRPTGLRATGFNRSGAGLRCRWGRCPCVVRSPMLCGNAVSARRA
jgi:hypothetical protein